MQTRPSVQLYLEGLLALVGAGLLIRTVSFSTVTRTVRPTARPMGTALTPWLVRDLDHVLQAWSRRLPWRSKCFEQGIACMWILGRRGIPALLYYGAATIDGALKAHVWVRSGDTDVIGCENAGDFAILSRFSNDSSSSPVQP